ncbi:xanthine phosphoribosyltransferase [Bradyrhizobium sp. HKCCYLS20291]|uniref:xanthine phosphoribosyltransferase n=1 Tax=Bradyrhizobium sp. HKCCYLS20291 TaxID=3420766 RepID=UPI003EBA1270
MSWDQLHRDCRALASRLQRAGPFYAIVTTSNGGLVVAAIVARELNIQTIETLCMSSQGESGPEEEPKILKKVADEVAAIAGGAGQGVLIIDDVATNSTVEVVRSMLPKAHVAAVYTRPISRSLVDTFITEVSTHSSIYLPWETAVAFQPPIHEDGS